METLNSSNISASTSVDSHDKHQLHEQIEKDAILASELAEQESNQDKDCSSDAALAMMLQKQFDFEYDSQLKRKEARLNGHSKVGVSLDKFKRSINTNQAESLSDNLIESFYDSENSDIEIDADSRLAWDVFEQSELKSKSRMMGRSGFIVDEDGNMITKHDIPTSSRKNMCRLMELKTDIETGDAGGSKDDFKITNYVYNRLKVHSKQNSRRVSQKLFEKKERENGSLLDEVQSCRMSDNTRAIMDGLLVAYKIEKLNGVIGHGKESTVLHATGVDHEDNPGQEVAIKIFRSNGNVGFKTRDTYNKCKCPSYKFDKPKSKNDSLNKWAERGFKNLKLLRKARIDCPDAISLKKHILVMTFLGSDALPSPQLRDANLTENELRRSYEQVIDIMGRMYNECNLIHGDLSEYNLLWHKNRVFVIDVSQSMFSSHPNANSFLFRDCKNILDFYRKSGLDKILDEKSLFTLVSGKNLCDNDIEFWSKIEDFPSNEKLMQLEENSGQRHKIPDCFGEMVSSTIRDDAQRGGA